MHDKADNSAEVLHMFRRQLPPETHGKQAMLKADSWRDRWRAGSVTDSSAKGGYPPRPLKQWNSSKKTINTFPLRKPRSVASGPLAATIQNLAKVSGQIINVLSCAVAPQWAEKSFLVHFKVLSSSKASFLMGESGKETATTSGERKPDEVPETPFMHSITMISVKKLKYTSGNGQVASALGLNPSATGREADTDVSFEIEPLRSLDHDLSNEFRSAAILEPADESTLVEILVQEEHVRKLGEEKGTRGDLSVTDIIHDDIRKAFARHSLVLRAIRAAKPEDKKPGYLGKDPRVSSFSSPKKKLLVLDIDQTLVFHEEEVCLNAVAVTALLEGNGRPHFVYGRQPNREFVWLRPHLPDFLAKCSNMFDVVAFSAAKINHVKLMQKCIDPSRKYIKHYFTRIYTTTCTFERSSGKAVTFEYLKDLTFLLDHKGQQNLVIIDDSLPAIALHLENAVPIPVFCGKQDDNELQKLLPFLEFLATVPDVTEPIRARYGSLWQHLFEPGIEDSDTSADVEDLLESLLDDF
eukprot:jgi/Botrbrau1/21989/Bobra.0024s0006.1